MKKIIYLLMFCLSTSLIACNDDDDSKKDDENGNDKEKIEFTVDGLPASTTPENGFVETTPTFTLNNDKLTFKISIYYGEKLNPSRKDVTFISYEYPEQIRELVKEGGIIAGKDSDFDVDKLIELQYIQQSSTKSGHFFGYAEILKITESELTLYFKDFGFSENSNPKTYTKYNGTLIFKTNSVQKE